MKLTRTLLVLQLALFGPLIAMAQGYELSSKWYTMKWSPGKWNGKHSFSDVYCLTFPAPELAIELGQGLYNRDSIHLTQVLYPDRVGAFIVVSTVPPGRSANEEIGRLLSLERKAESAYGVSYNIVESISDFGPTIELKLKDVAPQGRSAPFPLVRPIIRPARPPIETMSVHRLFVRGQDRFEVTTFQLAPNPAKETTEIEMSTRLTDLANNIVRAVYECTNPLPLRTPR